MLLRTRRHNVTLVRQILDYFFKYVKNRAAIENLGKLGHTNSMQSMLMLEALEAFSPGNFRNGCSEVEFWGISRS